MRLQNLMIAARRRVSVALTALTVFGLIFGAGIWPMRIAAQFTTGLLPGAQTGEAADAATRSFRAGRDRIEEERWPEAARSFTEFVASYPRHKNVDAALYWLAFALKKQGKLAEADKTLVRLIKEHPRSTWKDDAQAMRIEMAPQLGNQATINQALENDGAASDDELKVVALQSLVFTNPERALPMLQDVLKPEARASRNVKQTAVAFLGQMGARGVETLLDVARTHKDIELRRSAIFWLGQSSDERAFQFLKEIVMAGGEKKELLDSALFAIAQNRNLQAHAFLLELARSAPSADVRRSAIFNIGLRGGAAAIDELLAIYEAETDLEMKKHALFVLGMGGSQPARAKLLDIARGEANAELRKTAVFWLGQRGGEDTVAQLIQLFDAEQNNEVKEHLLMVLSQTRSKTALEKLMHIAKTSPSVELRKRAVFWLGQSKDPEAKKFIEEILK